MTPLLVQEPYPHPQRIGQEQFVFLVCQHGVEPTLKKCWLGESSRFRLAFSRPGLLTFKVAGEGATLPQHWLIRQSGWGLGQLRGSQAEPMIRDALRLAGTQWDAIHIFHRDQDVPGVRGFEPGPTPLTTEIGALFEHHLRSFAAVSRSEGDDELPPVFTPKAPVPTINQPCEPGSRVLDIVLVEPNQWLVGHHLAQDRHQCWPGGAFPVAPPAGMISRAYLKMAEAIAWSGLPIKSGDNIVEIGSSPGGSSQRLLDLGLHVTGVDPAEMHPLLMQHERFDHWRTKASGVKRRLFSKFRWLTCDANVAPTYTLEMLEDLVSYPTSRFEGLLLTIKLSSYDLVDQVPDYLSRIREWGFERVEVRQLAPNRQECAVVAQRSSTWKRPSRALVMQQTARSNAEKRRTRAAKKRDELPPDAQPSEQ